MIGALNVIGLSWAEIPRSFDVINPEELHAANKALRILRLALITGVAGYTLYGTFEVLNGIMNSDSLEKSQASLRMALQLYIASSAYYSSTVER